ncbi:MAG: hypothetical protein LBI27_00605 [Clostridiales bacterium]|nr:hypothetical protein [Clostridiales bacterium]
MARIKLVPEQLKRLQQTLQYLGSETDESVNKIAAVKSNLDWQVPSSSGIEARLIDLQRRLSIQAEKMNQYARHLDTVYNNFIVADRTSVSEARDLLYRMNQFIAVAASSDNLQPRYDFRKAAAFSAVMDVGGQFGSDAPSNTALHLLRSEANVSRNSNNPG